MIRRIEARHYKCLKRVDVTLEPLNVLVGPNASGKSTFLDLLTFLKEALATDVEEAVRKRAQSLQELVWMRGPDGFELAIEADIPQRLKRGPYTRVRYELSVGLDPQGEIFVKGENLRLVGRAAASPSRPQPSLFPRELDDQRPLVRTRTPPGCQLVVRKVGSRAYFRSETTRWNILFSMRPNRLALSGPPEDEERFPVTLWLRELLSSGLQLLQLNSLKMRRPCPPDAPRAFKPDGSNLPMVVKELMRNHRQRFGWWLEHLRTVLEDLEAVARAHGLGIWGAEETSAPPTPPTSPLEVVRFHYDAAGNDNYNLNDEYFVLRNVSGSPIDMSGWTASDEAGHLFRFPQGFVLEPGATVTVYTGCGTDTEEKLFWCSRRAIWNNDGDTLFLRDSTGKLVLKYSYRS